MDAGAHSVRCHADEVHQVPLPESRNAPILIQLLGHHYSVVPLVHLHLHLDALQRGCPHINHLNKAIGNSLDLQYGALEDQRTTSTSLDVSECTMSKGEVLMVAPRGAHIATQTPRKLACGSFGKDGAHGPTEQMLEVVHGAASLSIKCILFQRSLVPENNS
jgi:hypothetical protein